MANELDRVQAIAGKLKWALGIVAVIIGGVVALAYTASLASIAIALLATLVVVHGAPYASQRIANLFLNLRKADARADPVTNRQRISGETWERLKLSKAEIESLDGEVKLWEGQIKALPPEEAKDFAEDLRTAQNMVFEQARAWQEAETAAKEFDRITERVARKWKVAQTGLRIKKLSEKDRAARINDILAAEAAESADKQLAVAFSSLDAIIERGRASIQHNPSPAIDVQAVEIKQPVPLPRRQP